MAMSRRRAQRTDVVDLASAVWRLASGEEVSQYDLHEYIRCGEFPSEKVSKMPHLPEVELYMKRIEEAGRFVMPDEVF